MSDQPAFEHYESCTRDYIGRVVIDFLSDGIDAANIEGIYETARARQQIGTCSCLSHLFAAAEDQLRLARKRYRAGHVSIGYVDARQDVRDLLAAMLRAAQQ